MTITKTTLRPGLLVSLKTSVTGNVQYQRRTVEELHAIESGALKAAWETTRIINDPQEHETAAKVRNRCRTLISGVCAASAFGYLCPEEKAEDLEKAVAEARNLAETFNAQATMTRIAVYVMTGRVAPDDVEAVRAINSEVRELMDAMGQGLANLDVSRVRDAADRAKQLGVMLSTEAQGRIQVAIETARAAARKIVKAGETAAQEIDRQAIRKITEQRTAFLDLDDQAPIQTPAAEGRALDLAPTTEGPAEPPAPATPALVL